MRTREEISRDPKAFDALNLEVLLDIRELLGLKEIPIPDKPKEKRKYHRINHRNTKKEGV